MPHAQLPDELIAAAIRAVEEAETPPSRRSVVRHVVRESGCRFYDVRDAVLDYCERHDVTLAPPRPNPVRTAAGLAIGLLLLLLLLGGPIFVIGLAARPSGWSGPGPSWTGAADYGKYGWTALLTLLLLRGLQGNGLRQSLGVLRQVRPGLIVQNLLVALVTVGAALLLLHFLPFLDLSWLYLLPGNGHHAANLNIWPATIKYFGVLFLALLSLSLPALARAEEVKYRQGTRDWRDALGRSLRFGLAHCWVGVPLYAGLALTVGGLWFTLQYFRGGLERSTLHYVAYNLTVVGVLFALLLLRPA